MFLHPETNEFVKSDEIISGCSADEMKHRIKRYYKDVWRIEPRVTLKQPNAKTNVYTVEVPTAITDASVTKINTISMTTKSKIEIKYPKDLQLSDPAISGKYYLECSTLDGQTY